jgi:hypothetical protein
MTNGDKIRKAITDEWLAWYINRNFDSDKDGRLPCQSVAR